MSEKDECLALKKLAFHHLSIQIIAYEDLQYFLKQQL